MRHTVHIAATALGLMVGAGSASAFDLNTLNQLGIQVPDASSPFLCDAQPTDAYFEQFNCPLMAEAFWTGDYAPVQRFPKVVVAKYVQAFANTLHAPDLTYKVGAQVHAQLDPNLPIHLQHLMPADREIIGGAIGEEISILAGVVGGLLGAAEGVANSPNPNLADLLTAPAASKKNHPKHVMRATAFGNQDAVVWWSIAEQDPDTAVELYHGLRQLAYSL